MFDFNEVLEQCPFFKDAIDQYISSEISKVEAIKDAKIEELQATIDELTTAILMGGN